MRMLCIQLASEQCGVSRPPCRYAHLELQLRMVLFERYGRKSHVGATPSLVPGGGGGLQPSRNMAPHSVPFTKAASCSITVDMTVRKLSRPVEGMCVSQSIPLPSLIL